MSVLVVVVAVAGGSVSLAAGTAPKRALTDADREAVKRAVERSEQDATTARTRRSSVAERAARARSKRAFLGLPDAVAVHTAREQKADLFLTSGGGVVRAIIPRSGTASVRRFDEIDYVDANVTCGQQRIAKWMFLQSNPNGDRDHKMFGWTPIRTPTGAPRNCP